MLTTTLFRPLLLVAVAGVAAACTCEDVDLDPYFLTGSYTEPQEQWHCFGADEIEVCFELYRDGRAVVTEAGSAAALVHTWEESCDGVELDGEFDVTLSDFNGDEDFVQLHFDDHDNDESGFLTCSREPHDGCSS